ncbi:MAG: hypothetical protein ACLTZY_14180 [Alistipes indistinctus]
MIYDSDDFLLGRDGFVYGTGWAFGVEAMLQWQTDWLSLTAFHTYTNSRRRSDGVTYPFEYDIPHDFNTFMSHDVETTRQGTPAHLFAERLWVENGLPYRLTNTLILT